MKKVIQFSGFFFFAFLMTTYTGCKKDNEIPFNRIPDYKMATLTTTTISGITLTTAVAGGEVISDGGAEITVNGICLSTIHQRPTVADQEVDIGAGTGTFSGIITGLTPYTTYYVRAFAINKAGISYGNEVQFTTNNAVKATLTTLTLTSITLTNAVTGGNITDDGGAVITSRGVCWSINEEPTTEDAITSDGTGTGSFTSNLTDLEPGTTYFVRAYAVNSAGVTYGNQLSFTTGVEPGPIVFNPGLTYGSVSDIDGNIYNTIQIGTQVWMAENLKTTKYNDNTSIPYVTNNAEWMELTTGAYCWYNNNAATYKASYGALYNWYAVNTGKLCPDGWHVPSREEWMKLATYLGGVEDAGGKLKESGLTHWQGSNTGASNTTGFTALPGGLRDVSSDFGGFFFKINAIGAWWTSTPGIEPTHHPLWLDFNSGKFYFVPYWIYYNSGLSVRCLKD